MPSGGTCAWISAPVGRTNSASAEEIGSQMVQYMVYRIVETDRTEGSMLWKNLPISFAALVLAPISPARSGLPARLPCGDPPLLAGGLSLSLILFLVPSLISAPEPASLPEPASVRERFSGRAPAAVIAEGFHWMGTPGRPASGAEDEGALTGDMGRDGGLRLEDCGCEDVVCSFLCFLRDDSLPLAPERLGEPGRLRLFVEGFLERSEGLLDFGTGVEVPEESFDVLDFSRSDTVAFFSSSFLRSSSFFRSSSFASSVSVSSDSLYVASG